VDDDDDDYGPEYSTTAPICGEKYRGLDSAAATELQRQQQQHQRIYQC